MSCGFWAWYSESKGYSPYFCGGAICHREKCQKMFWQKRLKLVSALIEEHGLYRFFTLTLDRTKVKNEDSWDYIPHVWSKYRKRMDRALTLDWWWFKFAAVLEYHPKTLEETGEYWPHIHGFMAANIEFEYVQALWMDCGGGHGVNIKLIEGDAAEYVTKQLGRYVGKQNIVLAHRLRGKHRSFFRSLNTKAKFELTKKENDVKLIKEDIYDGEDEPKRYDEVRVYKW